MNRSINSNFCPTAAQHTTQEENGTNSNTPFQRGIASVNRLPSNPGTNNVDNHQTGTVETIHSDEEMSTKIDRILTFMEAAENKSKEWNSVRQRYQEEAQNGRDNPADLCYMNALAEHFDRMWDIAGAELYEVMDAMRASQHSSTQQNPYEPLVSKCKKWFDGGDDYALVRNGYEKFETKKVSEIQQLMMSVLARPI